MVAQEPFCAHFNKAEIKYTSKIIGPYKATWRPQIIVLIGR